MNNPSISKQNISDKQLADEVSQLTSEMTPERDLWSGIERAINHNVQQEKQQSNVFVPSAWAASIALVAMVSWFTFSPLFGDKQRQELVNTQPSSSELQGTLVTFMEQNFQQQKQALLVSYGQPSLNKLPPAMQQELKQLADARASISKALLADENNADLLNLLDFTQQQELKLLQQLYNQYQVI